MRVNDDKMDELEAAIQHAAEESDDLILMDFPLTHEFTKGFYLRTIFMPAGSILTSKIHKTRHPYVVSKGKVNVQIDGGEVLKIQAPYCGITEAGTRRALVVLEDCEWTTIHSLPYITGRENILSEEEKLKIVDGIEEEIIEKHENKLLIKNEELCLLQ